MKTDPKTVPIEDRIKLICNYTNDLINPEEIFLVSIIERNKNNTFNCHFIHNVNGNQVPVILGIINEANQDCEETSIEFPKAH